MKKTLPLMLVATLAAGNAFAEDVPIVSVKRLAMDMAVKVALVAGVGVSGAPAGETDEECAQAGVDAVMEDLEMAF